VVVPEVSAPAPTPIATAAAAVSANQGVFDTRADRNAIRRRAAGLA